MGQEREARLEQAVGVVSAQVRCSSDDARVLIGARAVEHGSTINQLVEEIMDRVIRFD